MLYGILIEKRLCCKVGRNLGGDFLCSVAYVLKMIQNERMNQ